MISTTTQIQDEAPAAITVGILGAGPAGLTLALALSARPGVTVTVFERAQDHLLAPRFDPDRSYTIDITGHGARALRYVDATARFDRELLHFKGIKLHFLGHEERCLEPGWTGSRGDICCALQKELQGRRPDCIRFQTEVEVADVAGGVLRLTGPDGQCTSESFDLVVGADGGGSAARRAMEAQVAGFSVRRMELSNHSRMLHLDQNTAELDPCFLHIFCPPPVLFVAGAINGENGPEDPMWFCQVGFAGKKSFASADEARRFLASAYPGIFKYASDRAVADFAKRACMPTGKAKICSAFHGGRLVLVGDAGAPFPPIGQGVNAAMEAATVLDRCIGEHVKLGSPTARADVLEAARSFTEQWQPESEAVRQISWGMDITNRWIAPKLSLYLLFGREALTNAKDGNMPYTQALARQKAMDRALVNVALAFAVGIVAAVAWTRTRSIRA